MNIICMTVRLMVKRLYIVILIIKMRISLRSHLREQDPWHFFIIGMSGWNKHHLFFIDEFDAFYHFELSESVQKRLGKISGVQIFTTTHNTDLMSNDLLRPDCYFLLKDNKIKAISDLTEKELRQAHNLQKMYKAGAFNG